MSASTPPKSQLEPFSLLFKPDPSSPGDGGKASEDRAALPPPEHNKDEDIAAFAEAVDAGEPFLKHDYILRWKGNVTLSPPPGLYPCIALVPCLAVRPEYDTWASHIIGFGPMFLAAVASIVAQITALYYVHLLTLEHHNELGGKGVCEAEGTASYLRIVCFGVFVMVQLSELKLAQEFYDYVRNVPNVPQAHRPILRSRNVNVLTHKKKVKGTSGEFEVEGFAAGGFTRTGRTWATFWALLDFLIAISVLSFGGAFVLYSDTNENLILNAVALNFISKIDDSSYEFIVTRTMKGWLEGLPDIGLVIGAENAECRVSKGRLIGQILGQWALVAILVVSSVALWKAVC
eukprot:CAMPEP_0197567918 /NCGR_PEP_ID=MMETSP1320-20131121/36412_1 /TAXON_ID=91990 /ORGANISM="Bolidomonas sp., Strain RCC2347" /LENGTH=346 /DNA_ID=CAMNT_0043130159 /DNA_START=13 /DNA_END=1053 /DNA_ORIENTATION=-